MKKFFTVIISLVILTIVGYSIAYLVRPVNSIPLEEFTHEISVSSEQAYIVRDETVYYAPLTGTVCNAVSEGDRVSNFTVISSAFNGSVDSTVLRKLNTIDNRIKNLTRSMSKSNLYSNDSASAESEISSKMNSITSLSKENNIEQIHSCKEDINNLRSGADASDDAKLAELQQEKESIEASLALEKTDIYSDRSGIFSTHIDGIETQLLPENVQYYDPSYIRSLSPVENRYTDIALVTMGDPICKVMNNHLWYILGITNGDYAQLFRDHETVTVRFSGLTGSEAKGTVSYLSDPDENNECVFLIQIPSYVESAFSYRTADADIIFEKYAGYKIPTESIHTGDTMDDFYVYATLGSETYRCDCDILYTDPAEGYSIICSKEDAENRLSFMERLIVGER